MDPLGLSQPYFRNLADCELYGHNLHISSGSQALLKGNNLNTVAEESKQIDHPFTFPDKNANHCLEISFQKGFLNEHIASFHQKFKNLVEHALDSNHTTTHPSLASILEYCLPQQQSTLTLRDLLGQQMGHVNSEQITLLLKDWKSFLDIQRFLDYLVKVCRVQLAGQLVGIAFAVWFQTRGVNFRFIEAKQLLARAGSWVKHSSDEYFQRNKVKYVNLRAIEDLSNVFQQQFRTHFMAFLKYFVTTVLFVLAGFFQNPYLGGVNSIDVSAQIDYPKRETWSNRQEVQSFWQGSQFSLEELSGQPRKQQKE